MRYPELPGLGAVDSAASGAGRKASVQSEQVLSKFCNWSIVPYFFQAFGAEYADELLVRGVDKRGEIKEHPKALADAFELGKKLAQE